MKIAILTTDGREVLKAYNATEPYFGTAVEALLQGFPSQPGTEIHVLSCIRQPVKSPAQVASNVFFHSLVVPKIGWMRTGYQGCIRAVRTKLREIKPDLVHGQGTEADCAISAVFSGYPNVVTVHGNMRLIAHVTGARAFSFPWLAAKLEGFTLPRTDGVVCITRYTQEAVAPVARRTWLAPNAVDATIFDLEARPQSDPMPAILCVGVVCLRKNQNAFIRSLDGLAAKHKFKLSFIGQASEQNPYGAEFFRLVRERSWCNYAGTTDREGIKAHLRNSTMLALPSLEDNCPMVVLEAMAANMPVVAAKVGGVPDLVEDKETGIFCDPLNPESMRAAVENILAHPQASQEMAARAKTRARERYHPVVIARRHLEIYRELLNKVS